MQWIQARRAEKMNPSVIREILKPVGTPGTGPMAPRFAGMGAVEC